FLYDRLNGTTTLLTANRFGHGSADNRSLTPVFSADGGTLAFVSWASDLIPNDFNSSADIFALDVYNGTNVGTFELILLPDSTPAGGSWLSWPVTGASSYRVEFKNALQDAWQELSGQISVIGSRAYLKDGLAA